MFKIGDTVICIDDTMLPHTRDELIKDVPNWVKKDKIYHIRNFADHDFVVGVYLEEIHNPPKWFNLVGGFIEPAFKESRFRKLEETKIEISVEQEQLITL